LGGVLGFGLGMGWGDTLAFWMEIFSPVAQNPRFRPTGGLFFFSFFYFPFLWKCKGWDGAIISSPVYHFAPRRISRAGYLLIFVDGGKVRIFTWEEETPWSMFEEGRM